MRIMYLLVVVDSNFRFEGGGETDSRALEVRLRLAGMVLPVRCSGEFLALYERSGV